MLYWWNNLSRRGKFIFWGVLGIIANGGTTFLLNFWLPILFFCSLGLILLAFIIPNDD